MKFKEMEDKSLEQIRYNPYTVGIHKEKKEGKRTEIKKVAAIASILNVLNNRGLYNEAQKALRSKQEDPSLKDVIREMIRMVEEDIESKEGSLGEKSLG